jgi:steroid delta-isomerase-like uncharacterized protein
METQAKLDLVFTHLKAEGAGDVDGAVAVYTDDVEHDVVGFPGGPTKGIAGARHFYDELTANFRTDDEQIVRQYEHDDALVLESLMTGRVIGQMFGVPGHGKSVTFRILHVFEFRDGLISRENVWLDAGAVIHQLTA